MLSRVPLAIGLLIGLVAGALWLLAIAFDESRSMTRYSPDALVLIPSVLRDVPEIDVVGEVTFHSSCGDGPKPASEAVWYDSTASEAVLQSQVRGALREHGYVCADLICREVGSDDEDGENVIELTVTDNGKNVRRVEVWHYP